MGSKTSQPDPAAAQREESESLPCSKVKVLDRDMPGEPRQDSSWQRVSLVTAASVTKYSGAAQELDGRVNPEKRTWERRSMAGIGTVADTVGVKLVEKLIDEICEGTKKEQEAEATKPQESWMKEDFQELIQQGKAMREDLQKGQESRKTEEGNPSKSQGSGMEETLVQLCKEMKAMREDLQKGQESTNCLIQLLIEDQNKEQGKTEKKNTPNPQGSGSEGTLLQFCKQMKTMCEDLQKGQESTKQDIQLLRADLNKELDRKMKKMAKAQESKMDKKLQQLFQRILERELHGRQHILQLPRAEMEIEQGVLIESASEDEGTDVDA